jgi:hypothetical protein
LKYTEITDDHRDACIQPVYQKCHPGGFFGAQQDYASIGRHGLMRLDPPEADILAAQVVEAG